MRKATTCIAVALALLAWPGIATGAVKKVSAVGDIAKGPPSGDYDPQRDTAQRVLDHAAVKVFLLGDTQYNTGKEEHYKCAGTLASTCGSFHTNSNSGLTPRWGDFDNVGTNPEVIPAVGNHEYYDDATGNSCPPNCDGAEGFRNYFGKETGVDHGPLTTDPWDNAFFYTTNVNTGAVGANWDNWRFYVIDSMVCNVDPNECDDTAADNDQYDELETAIAADQYRDPVDPTQQRDCVGAIWHHSRFSNEESHGDDTDMRDIYDLLDDFAGVDLIITGHSHLYEKFPRQDADGNFMSGAPRLFVAGAGGTGDLRTFDINQNVDGVWDNHTNNWVPGGAAPPADPWSNNAHDDAAYANDHGILNLWLSPGQFDTQYREEENGNIKDPFDGTGGDGQNGAAWEYACSNDPSV